jgi:hypothetical protein
MIIALLVAGIAVLVAGLLALGLGISEKEFEVGKTLIVSGTMAACAGFIVLSVVAAIGELREIARRLGPSQAAVRRPRADAPLPSFPVLAPEPSLDSPPLEREPPAGEGPIAAQPAMPPSPPPWQEEATRSRQRGNPPLPPAAPQPPPLVAKPAPEPKPRRNLLFSSSSRKERERAAARAPEATAPDPNAAVPPPIAPAPPPEAGPPRTFDDAWPAAEPVRAEPYRRPPRVPSTSGEAGAAPGPAAAPTAPPPAPDERSQVTVLKSGVVDGMAYSLYSDGSIEAQMPEGMMRFASIGELREHLDQRP